MHSVQDVIVLCYGLIFGKELGGNSYISVHVICKHLIDNAKMAKVLKSKILNKLYCNGPSECKTRYLLMKDVDKTEFYQKILTAQHLRRKFEGVEAVLHINT